MLTDWLKSALRSSGMSQAELSRLLTKKLGRSIDPAAVNKMVSGKRAIAADEMMAIAELTNVNSPAPKRQTVVESSPVGLPILGTVTAGNWLETRLLDEGEDREMLVVPADPRWPRARQYALWVQGDSMNQEFPDGSCVTCVDFAETGLDIRPGMTVHVERYRFDGQEVEATLKMVQLTRGKFILAPRSTNPKYQPFPLESDSGTSVVIKGLVTGSWRRKEY